MRYLKQANSESKFQVTRGGEMELLFNGYRVSVRDNENVLERVRCFHSIGNILNASELYT